MIANLESLFISSRLQKQPIYEALAHQDGIHLPNVKTRDGPDHRRVVQVMLNAQEFLPAQMGIREAADHVRSSEIRTWLVADEGSLVGVLSWVKLERALEADGASGKKLYDLLDTNRFPARSQ